MACRGKLSKTSAQDVPRSGLEREKADAHEARKQPREAERPRLCLQALRVVLAPEAIVANVKRAGGGKGGARRVAEDRERTEAERALAHAARLKVSVDLRRALAAAERRRARRRQRLRVVCKRRLQLCQRQL